MFHIYNVIHNWLSNVYFIVSLSIEQNEYNNLTNRSMGFEQNNKAF